MERRRAAAGDSLSCLSATTGSRSQRRGCTRYDSIMTPSKSFCGVHQCWVRGRWAISCFTTRTQLPQMKIKFQKSEKNVLSVLFLPAGWAHAYSHLAEQRDKWTARRLVLSSPGAISFCSNLFSVSLNSLPKTLTCCLQNAEEQRCVWRLFGDGVGVRWVVLRPLCILLVWHDFSGKGGKNRRRGKNENDNDKRELVFKEDGQGEC